LTGVNVNVGLITRLTATQFLRIWTARRFLANVKLTFMFATLCLKKRPTFDLLWSLHTRLDCDNFWRKFCRETRQSKCPLFSHLT